MRHTRQIVTQRKYIYKKWPICLDERKRCMKNRAIWWDNVYLWSQKHIPLWRFLSAKIYVQEYVFYLNEKICSLEDMVNVWGCIIFYLSIRNKVEPFLPEMEMKKITEKGIVKETCTLYVMTDLYLHKRRHFITTEDLLDFRIWMRIE